VTDLQHRLLAHIVRDPGCWTARELAAAVDPPRWIAQTGGYSAWLEIRRQHTKRIQGMLSRLQQAGYVEKQRPPRLAPWFTERVREMGPRSAVQRLRPVTCDGLDWAGDDDEDAEGPVTERDPDAVALVRLLLDAQRNKVDPRTRDLLKGASGGKRRAYRWLCEEGAIEAPSLRWPTAAGVSECETTREAT